MKNFIIKNGSFFNREDDQTSQSLTGFISDILTIADNGVQKLKIILKNDLEGEPEEFCLTTKLYGDAALKILRCLFSVVGIIKDTLVELSLEKVEGKPSAISVKADGLTLSPCGVVEYYLSEKKLITDRITAELKYALRFNGHYLAVLVPKVEGDEPSTSVADYLSNKTPQFRATCRIDERNFSSGSQMNGYRMAATSFAPDCHFFLVEGEDIEIVKHLVQDVEGDNPGNASVEEEC